MAIVLLFKTDPCLCADSVHPRVHHGGDEFQGSWEASVPSKGNMWRWSSTTNIQNQCAVPWWSRSTDMHIMHITLQVHSDVAWANSAKLKFNKDNWSLNYGWEVPMWKRWRREARQCLRKKKKKRNIQPVHVATLQRWQSNTVQQCSTIPEFVHVHKTLQVHGGEAWGNKGPRTQDV